MGGNAPLYRRAETRDPDMGQKLHNATLAGCRQRRIHNFRTGTAFPPRGVSSAG
jgi:hypothetical protein